MTPRSSVAICEKYALLKIASIKAVRALSCWNLCCAATVMGAPSPIPGGTPVNELVMPTTIGTSCGPSEPLCWFAVIGWRARPEPVLYGGVSAESGFDLGRLLKRRMLAFDLDYQRTRLACVENSGE